MFSCVFLSSPPSAKYKILGRSLILQGNILHRSVSCCTPAVIWSSVCYSAWIITRILKRAKKNLMQKVIESSWELRISLPQASENLGLPTSSSLFAAEDFRTGTISAWKVLKDGGSCVRESCWRQGGCSLMLRVFEVREEGTCMWGAGEGPGSWSHLVGRWHSGVSSGTEGWAGWSPEVPSTPTILWFWGNQRDHTNARLGGAVETERSAQPRPGANSLIFADSMIYQIVL